MSSLARIQELDLKRVEEGRENCDTCSVSVGVVRGQILDTVSHEGVDMLIQVPPHPN
jgi:hypothetical protein